MAVSSLGKGVTLLSASAQGQFSPILLTAGQTLAFNHGLNRRAFQVLVTNQDGQMLNLPVDQPQAGDRYDSLVIENNTLSSVEVFVFCRWEEASRELSLIAFNDERLAFYEPPDLFWQTLFFSNSYDAGEGWPGTFANSEPTPTFSSLFQVENADNGEGWPGTFANPEPTPTFSALTTTTFEAEGNWPGFNNPPIGDVGVTGVFAERRTLTAYHTLVDDDGTTSSTFVYEWFHEGSDTVIGTGETYELVASDVGQNIYVVVSYTDDLGTNESVASPTYGPITEPINEPPAGDVTISGSAIYGQTLTVTNSLTDPDGMTTSTVTYQWYRVETSELVSTGSTYVPAAGDVGNTLYVVATYTDDGGTTESYSSEPFGPIAATTPLLELLSITPVQDGNFYNLHMGVRVIDDGGASAEPVQISMKNSGSSEDNSYVVGFDSQTPLSTGETGTFISRPIGASFEVTSGTAMAPGYVHELSLGYRSSAGGFQPKTNTLNYTHPSLSSSTQEESFASLDSFDDTFDATRAWPGTISGDDLSDPATRYSTVWDFDYRNQLPGATWSGGNVGIAETYGSGDYRRRWDGSHNSGTGLIEANAYCSSAVLGGALVSPAANTAVSMSAQVSMATTSQAYDGRSWIGLTAFAQSGGDYFSGYSVAIEQIFYFRFSRQVLTLRKARGETSTTIGAANFTNRYLLGGIVAMKDVPNQPLFVRLDAIPKNGSYYFNVYTKTTASGNWSLALYYNTPSSNVTRTNARFGFTTGISAPHDYVLPNSIDHATIDNFSVSTKTVSNP